MSDVWKFDKDSLEAKVVEEFAEHLPSSMKVQQIIPLMIEQARGYDDFETEEEMISHAQYILERSMDNDGFIFQGSTEDELEAAIQRLKE